MPTVTVHFFGPARDLADEQTTQIDVDAEETVGRFAGRLAQRFPKLGNAPGVRLAVNQKYAPIDQRLADGDEVAVIPPVSGG